MNETEVDARTTATKTVLITGGAGLLGGCLVKRLGSSGWRAIGLSHSELDITREDGVRRVLDRDQPAVVINCAATTDVDRCEREPEWAYAVNEGGPRNLARACRERGATLVHISTDYVFDGSKEGFYIQDDEPNPLSVYAKSKLAGEIAVREEIEPAFVIRSSWIFGRGGKNFGSRLFEYAAKGARLKGVVDQTSIPTYAPDLAGRIDEIVALGHYGLYQATNSGVGSWYDFARLALDRAGLGHIKIEPVTRADLGQAAARPRNSAMRCLLSEELGLAPLRDWREAAVEFVDSRQEAGTGRQ